MSNRSLWVNFATLRQESWHHGNVVLLGDAAHTAHFSIGSGTKLAMEDSIALVDALRRHRDLPAALNDYEMERQPVVERFQEAAHESSSYFEHVSRYAQFDPRQFAFNLLTRSRRITYVNLTQRDPELVRTVDSWFAAAATGSPDGVVRPLRHGGWKLMAASPIAYTPHAPLPKEMTARDIAHVVKVFGVAATAAAGCWLDALDLNFAHGYLLAGFISPLTNRRTDDYGGLLENRMRFPLEVLDAVRAIWDRPLMVRISASDWAPGGSELDEAVAMAALLKAHGGD